jgi:hypothetical protein
MTAEWVTALAAVGTLAVVAATAIAALVQLRHMRGSNQIAALMECRAMMEAPETRRTLGFIAHELPKRLADPTELEKIAVIPPVEPDYLAVVTVGNLLESIGTLVKRGMIEKDITCDYWAAIITMVWKRTAPITYVARKIAGAALWENFEYLVTVAEDYQKRHPTSYPPGAPRMPPDTSMFDAMEKRRSPDAPA